MFQFERALLPLLAFSALLAPRADAHGFELILGKKSKHGSISLTIGNGAEYGHRGHAPVCAPPRAWIAGHYETRCERVWIPGRCESVWVEPVYQWRHDSCGRAYQVVVCAGYWKTVEQPGCWQERNVQVWVEGHWQ